MARNLHPTYDDLIPPAILTPNNPGEGEGFDPHSQKFTTRFRQRRGSYGRRRRGSLKKGNRKNVTFHNHERTSIIRCDYDMLTRSEMKSVWYKSKDYESFEKEKRKTIRKLKDAGGDVTALNAAKYSLRGIEEYQSIQTYREKRQKRMEHVRAVLNEQDRQIQMNVHYDPYTFRNIVKESTESSKEQALIAAQRDERHAAEVYDVDDNNSPTVRRNRRVSVRWVPVDRDDQIDSIPMGGGRRDSLNLTKLKQSVLSSQALLSEDDELKSFVSDEGSNRGSTSELQVDLAKFAEEFAHLYDDDEYNEPLPPPVSK